MKKYTIHAEWIEEAIMRHLEKYEGASYDELCSADFKIIVQGESIEDKKLHVFEADFKTARVEVEIR